MNKKNIKINDEFKVSVEVVITPKLLEQYAKAKKNNEKGAEGSLNDYLKYNSYNLLEDEIYLKDIEQRLFDNYFIDKKESLIEDYKKSIENDILDEARKKYIEENKGIASSVKGAMNYLGGTGWSLEEEAEQHIADNKEEILNRYYENNYQKIESTVKSELENSGLKELLNEKYLKELRDITEPTQVHAVIANIEIGENGIYDGLFGINMNLRGTRFKNVYFNEADLRGVNLSDCDLRDCNFINCKMQNVDLRGTDLYSTKIIYNNGSSDLAINDEEIAKNTDGMMLSYADFHDFKNEFLWHRTREFTTKKDIQSATHMALQEELKIQSGKIILDPVYKRGSNESPKTKQNVTIEDLKEFIESKKSKYSAKEQYSFSDFINEKYKGKGNLYPSFHKINFSKEFKDNEILKGLNLSGTDFFECNFFKLNLEGVILNNCCLQNANFQSANLKNSSMESVNAPYADFSNADLTNAFSNAGNFEGCKFQKKANLENGSFIGANFRNVGAELVRFTNGNISNANCYGMYAANAQMDNIKAIGTVFEKAILDNASLINADLEKAILDKASLIKANLENANLKNVKAVEANLKQASLKNINAEFANFKKAFLKEANLEKANFKKAILSDIEAQKANFTKAIIEEADLKYAKLEEAILEETKAKGADFSFAMMKKVQAQKASFVKAKLEAINAEMADFTQASFDQADLEYANLKKAVLKEANIKRAKLQKANLTEADARKADFKDAEIDENTTLLGTIFGEGEEKAKNADHLIAQQEQQKQNTFGNVLWNFTKKKTNQIIDLISETGKYGKSLLFGGGIGALAAFGIALAATTIISPPASAALVVTYATITTIAVGAVIGTYIGHKISTSSAWGKVSKIFSSENPKTKLNLKANDIIKNKTKEPELDNQKTDKHKENVVNRSKKISNQAHGRKS